MISDHVWELLAPATVAYEDVGREEAEQGLSEGTFTLFESPKSAAVTCAPLPKRGTTGSWKSSVAPDGSEN